ncbi:hypothetical protein EYF80_025318 [Liparis tanakae]|uniref:Uncharacterized protein n=1 Tax=Liparis tanakae TaxID=230148 RepID=A0A4Z2HF17_9TELE|nr:hypothetical protein EYF80_025318 [Liparis tanakae]
MDPCRDRPGDVPDPGLCPDSKLSVSKVVSHSSPTQPRCPTSECDSGDPVPFPPEVSGRLQTAMWSLMLGHVAKLDLVAVTHKSVKERPAGRRLCQEFSKWSPITQRITGSMLTSSNRQTAVTLLPPEGLKDEDEN